MKITDEQVLHVAGLARLTLSELEIGKLRKELDSILEYMDLLSEIKTRGNMFTHESSSPGTVLRPDVAEPGQGSSAALSNAPQQHDGFVAVPRVIE